MKLEPIKYGWYVRCIGAQYCGMNNCRHYKKHEAEASVDSFYKDCKFPAYCSIVEGFVMDQYCWARSDDCPCDPNLEFRRRRLSDEEA